MKENILARFKLKFPAINLRKPVQDALAARIEAKAPIDDTAIDAMLDAMNEAYPFLDQAKNDDKTKGLEDKLKAEQAAKKKLEQQQSARQQGGNSDDLDNPMDPADELPEDTPNWMKVWARANAKKQAALETELAKLQGEKQQTTIRNKIADAFKDKDGNVLVPDIIWSERRLPEKEEDIEAFVSKVQTQYGDFTKEKTDQQFTELGAGPRQHNRQVVPVDSKVKATDAEVKDVLSGIMPNSK